MPTLPAPDWSAVRMFLRFLRLIGPLQELGKLQEPLSKLQELGQ